MREPSQVISNQYSVIRPNPANAMTDYWSLVTDYYSPMTDYWSLDTDYCCPTTDYFLLITDYYSPKTDYYLLATDHSNADEPTGGF